MIFTEEQISLRDMIADFLRSEVTPHVSRMDKAGKLDSEIADKLAEMGLNAMYLPKAYGGLEFDHVTSYLLAEELGKCDCGIGSMVGANNAAANMVMLFGNEDQKKRFADIIIRERTWGAITLTEPNSGSDVSHCATTATEDGNDYVLNGTKCFITNGGIAGVYSVLATVDRSLGYKGLICLMVERTRKGISIGKEEDKMGIRLSNTTEVVFDEVRVPKENVLCPVGKGIQTTLATLTRSRPHVGAIAVGLAQHALDEAVSYAKVRTQFGKPIGELQSVQNILADIAMEVEACRQLVYHTAELIDAGKPFGKYSSITKCLCSDMSMRATVNALQVFGGYGYMREYPMEKLMRDAKILQIYEGTNQVQRGIIAHELLK